jgi:dihydrodipicolinate synthase/N-acetylneuraminate lyase
LYLYDLPVRTGVALDISTYEALAKHPNIRGAKISGRIDFARELRRRLPDDFRIIVAEPQIMAELMREGIAEHLDGIYAAAPHWFVELAQAANAGDWPEAMRVQVRVNQLLDALRSSPSVMGALTAMLNARGIPGNFHAAPARTLSQTEKSVLLGKDIVKELIQHKSASCL